MKGRVWKQKEKEKKRKKLVSDKTKGKLEMGKEENERREKNERRTKAESINGEESETEREIENKGRIVGTGKNTKNKRKKRCDVKAREYWKWKKEENE